MWYYLYKNNKFFEPVKNDAGDITNNHERYYFLLIRRKDTLGYVDFIRGRYPYNNINYIMNIINEMTEDEKDMIYDMVSNLNERIKSEGGTFDEWFKLIRSYLVLGENELALERFNEAKDIFQNSANLIVRLENLVKSFIN